MDVQVEAQCGSHRKSRVRVARDGISSSQAPPTRPSWHVLFQIGVAPMHCSMGCCLEREAPITGLWVNHKK